MSNIKKSFLLMLLAAILSLWIVYVIKIYSVIFSSVVIFLIIRFFALVTYGATSLNKNFIKNLKIEGYLLMLVMTSCYTISFILYFYALTKIPMAIASLFMYSAPLYIPLFAYFILNDKSMFEKVFWFGLSISFIGVIMILIPDLNFKYPFFALICAIFSGVLFAASQVLTKKLLANNLSGQVVLFQVIMSFIIALVPSLIIIYTSEISYISNLFAFKAFLFFLGAGICSWYFQVLRAKAVSLTSVSVVIPFGYMGVLFIGILDYLVFNVTLYPLEFVGMLLVIFGIIILLKKTN